MHGSPHRVKQACKQQNQAMVAVIKYKSQMEGERRRTTDFCFPSGALQQQDSGAMYFSSLNRERSYVYLPPACFLHVGTA